MLRLLLGFALLCTYNGGQVTALPHIGPPDVPQSEEPAINIISGKEKRAPILKHQTHWKVLISSNEAIPTELIEEYYGTQNEHAS